MQTKLRRPAVVLALLALTSSLFAFTTKFGGDSFEVWINEKMVVRQYLHGDNSVKNIVLQESNYNDKISFKYSHCGQQGKERSITLKDENDRVLKQWTYKNEGPVMTFHAKDVMDIQKSSSTTIRLYYSSREIPNGKFLVSMTKSTQAISMR